MAQIAKGTMVPFLLGMPSVRARVLGISQDDQYVLYHGYYTVNRKGQTIYVEKTYYRDRYFIESYWADVTGLSSN